MVGPSMSMKNVPQKSVFHHLISLLRSVKRVGRESDISPFIEYRYHLNALSVVISYKLIKHSKIGNINVTLIKRIVAISRIHFMYFIL